MHVHLIYFNYLNPDGEGFSIGGIQTYITNLLPVLRECGHTTTIYQRSSLPFHKEIDGTEIYGIAHQQNYNKTVARAIIDAAIPHIDMSHDLVLYGCESCIARALPCRTIAIQHGISWDVAKHLSCSPLQYIRYYVSKCRRAWTICQRVAKVNTLVCVDNNFINWYRAVLPYPKAELKSIPNFSTVPPTRPTKSNSSLHIIFARRFFIHRGTRLFAKAAQRIIADYPDVHITIAGSGPDADYMHKILDRYDNIQFITYDSQDSLRLHRDMDIAVVPTTGSEGTSLSLLEAMASGCATICTNVGGMTNIVLDGFNGIMISPAEDELYEALRTLIDQPDKRERLQQNAYDTAKYAFDIVKWKQKWTNVLSSVK